MIPTPSVHEYARMSDKARRAAIVLIRQEQAAIEEATARCRERAEQTRKRRFIDGAQVRADAEIARAVAAHQWPEDAASAEARQRWLRNVANGRTI